jgi:hypothetical protein
MNKKLIEEIVTLLECLKGDAYLALSGDWDCSDEGFNAQIKSINKLLRKLKKYDTRNN